MALIDLIEPVAADFVASGCPARVLWGKESVAQNDSPNRVVFVPDADTYALPHTTGHNPRQVMSREVGCQVHIWGAAPKQLDGSQQTRADQRVLDALVNQVVLSLGRQSALPGINFTAGTQRQEAVAVAFGAAYILKFSVQIPVLDIRFPDLGITEDVLTWRVVDPVTADIDAFLDTLSP